MRSARSRAETNEQGLGLVELLVAVAVLAVATTLALTLYDGARRSFKGGENVTEQQQAVRIAFDMLTADLRMAGFNTNPDGNKARPDEQIEAALSTAVVVRSDFDFGDPVASRDPETVLAGGAFVTVSTGNDEIRGFALAKSTAGGRAGPDSFSFGADISSARDGVVNTIVVDQVALTHSNPPYTLYRIALDGSGDPVAEPLIDNVRSLRFRYFDRRGFEVGAVGGIESAAARLDRAAIRRIHVEIEVLTRDPEPLWVDAEDTNPATRSRRKFLLAGDVTPRNLGLAGFREFLSGVFHPTRPDRPELYPGHCGGVYVTWEPNPIEEEIRYYQIRYQGTSPPTPVQVRTSRATQYYVSGLADATDHTFWIQALNAGGEASVNSPAAVVTTSNLNTPRAPTSLVATDDENGFVRLTWARSYYNTTSLSWDPLKPRLRDLAGYRIYRSENPGFTAGASNRIADESAVPAVSLPFFEDRSAVNCTDYFYRVKAVDGCGIESLETAEVEGRAVTSVPPAPPGLVEAFFHNASTARVVWDPTMLDADGDPIHVDSYGVYWSGPVTAFGPPPAAGAFSWIGDVENGETEYYHFLGSPVPDGQAVWYAVKAKDPCPNESALSAPARPLCYFSGNVVIETPAAGSTVSGPTEVRVRVVDGAGTYEKLRLIFTGPDGPSSYQYVSPGPVWTHVWDAGAGGSGGEEEEEEEEASGGPTSYTILAEVDQRNGVSSTCTSRSSIQVLVAP